MIEKLLGRELLVQNKCQILLINCLLFALTKSGDSQISPTSLISSPLSGEEVNKPPSPPTYYCHPLIHDRLYQSITIVKLCVDWSRFILMVYSPAGSLDLFFFILGCMISNFLYLSFSTLHSNSLWITYTIIFAKLIMPPPPPPQRCLK